MRHYEPASPGFIFSLVTGRKSRSFIRNSLVNAREREREARMCESRSPLTKWRRVFLMPFMKEITFSSSFSCLFFFSFLSFFHKYAVDCAATEKSIFLSCPDSAARRLNSGEKLICERKPPAAAPRIRYRTFNLIMQFRLLFSLVEGELF